VTLPTCHQREVRTNEGHSERPIELGASDASLILLPWMSDAVAHPDADADAARLSPLVDAHLNVYLDNGRTISVLGVALS